VELDTLLGVAEVKMALRVWAGEMELQILEAGAGETTVFLADQELQYYDLMVQ
jgi:hypothetical protein